MEDLRYRNFENYGHFYDHDEDEDEYKYKIKNRNREPYELLNIHKKINHKKDDIFIKEKLSLWYWIKDSSLNLLFFLLLGIEEFSIGLIYTFLRVEDEFNSGFLYLLSEKLNVGLTDKVLLLTILFDKPIFNCLILDLIFKLFKDKDKSFLFWDKFLFFV